MKKQPRCLEWLVIGFWTMGLPGTVSQAEGSSPFTVQAQPEGSLDSSFQPTFSAEFATALTIVATQFDGAMWVDRSNPHPVPLLARLSAAGAQIDYYGGLGGYPGYWSG